MDESPRYTRQAGDTSSGTAPIKKDLLSASCDKTTANNRRGGGHTRTRTASRKTVQPSGKFMSEKDHDAVRPVAGIPDDVMDKLESVAGDDEKAISEAHLGHNQ